MTLRGGFDGLSLARLMPGPGARRDSAPRVHQERACPSGSTLEVNPWGSATTAVPETIEEVDEETETGGASRTDLVRPYKIIFLNDNVTTMEFVVAILMNLFHLDQTTAVQVMLEVHHTGAAVVAILPQEEAELRQQQVHEAARAAGFPLRCLIEPA